jgi:phosphoglycerate dehydrogenase-like enzyme
MTVNKIAILYEKDPNANPIDITAEHEDEIRRTVPGATLVRASDESALLQRGADCDVLLTWGMYQPARFLAAARELKWVHVLSAGFDGVVSVPAIREKRLAVTSTRGIHGLPIAEHTLCMMLMFTRGFHLLRDRQHRKRWERYAHPDELAGKTAAVLGVGEVGRVIAQKCKAVGMRVLGLDLHEVDEPSLDRFYPAKELLALLPETDYVVVAVPLTADTRGWIAERQLRAMKQSAYLFNIARGPIIDSAALIRALNLGWIAGAGLDALDPEPLPSESALWDFPNVIVSPHMAAISPYYMDRAIKVFCENLQRFAQGEPLRFQFDWEKGF